MTHDLPVRDKLGPLQLGIILGTAMGLPAMVVGDQISKKYGAGTAISSILTGNLLLWIIGLAIVSMASKKSDAIENVKTYLGNNSGIVAALILIPAFIVWYALQIKGVTIPLANLLCQSKTVSTFYELRTGVGLGVLITLLSVGGIKLIKWISLISLPILIVLGSYVIYASNSSQTLNFAWGISIEGIVLIVLTWLPGYINIPTFNRHSFSKADSFFALTIMAILHMCFQLFTIFVEIGGSSDISWCIEGANSEINLGITLSFILISFICINLVNIYFASAGWDAIFPKYKGALKYPIISLIGIGTYILFPFSAGGFYSPLVTIEKIFTILISNLGVVLLINSLIRVIVNHRPRIYEKIWSTCCWVFGSVVGIISQIRHPDQSLTPLFIGISFILLAFLIICFIEETLWSIKNLN